jgi:hypothetical protein
MNGKIEEFIRQNPQKAQQYAEEWSEAARDYGIPLLQSREEWESWRQTNRPGLDRDLWVGKEILQALTAVPPSTEPEKPEGSSSRFSLLGLLGAAVAPLAFSGGPEILEGDSSFLKIIEEKKTEWLKNNPGKDFSSKEGIDYLYGDLDDPEKPTVNDDAEKAFREKYSKKANYYDEQAKKLVKNPIEDHAVQRAKKNIENHTRARQAYYEEHGMPEDWEDVKKRIGKQEWDRFLKRYPEKANAYRSKIDDIDKALERLTIKQKIIDFQETQKHLEAYKEATGKEINPTAKTKREAPKISIEEATKRLESLTSEHNISKSGRITPRMGVSEATKRLEQIAANLPSQQLYTPRSFTPAQPPGRRKKGLIDFANRLPSAFNSLRNIIQTTGKVLRALQTLARTLFSSPYFWVFTIIAFIILVIIISGEGGGFSIGGSGGGAGIPTGGGQQGSGNEPPSLPPIPGLTLTLYGPDSINNGELISYTVDVYYDPATATTPIEDITVFDNLPLNIEFSDASGIFQYDSAQKNVSWSLSEGANQTGFSITLKPLIGDFFISNKVYARANAPIAPGGVCSEGTGFCSVQYLSSFFPDQSKARQASIICQRESGGYPAAINNGCLSGKSADYSVGLFQINMLAHCPGAFSNYTLNPPSCTVADQNILNACVSKYSDPIENIKKAVELSSGGTYWVPWSAAKACGII